MQFSELLARLRARASDTYHCRLASLHLHHGNLVRARDHYRRVSGTGDSGFVAHVGLGRIYLKQQRIALAMEELHRAREIDPQRFTKIKLPGGLLLAFAERFPDRRPPSNPSSNGLHSVRGGSDSRSGRDDNSRSDSPTSDSRAAEQRRPDLLSFDAELEVEPLPFGDFRSRAEAEKFAVLPPIALSDAEEVNWDQFSEELAEEDES